MISRAQILSLLIIVVVVASFFCAQAFARDDELTFIVWSDTHFGAYDYTQTTRLEVIEMMNNLPGRQYPPNVGGDVGTIDFMIHCGDITERGEIQQWDNPAGAPQQSYLQCLKTLTATKTIYEVLGNHDINTGDTSIYDAIEKKHGNVCYSFTKKGVHFIMLTPYKQGDKISVLYPDLNPQQLKWLHNDITSLKKDTPVILAMHIAPKMKSAQRYSQLGKTSARLYDFIKDRNVLGFFCGHFHTTFVDDWRNIKVMGSGYCYWEGGASSLMSPCFLVGRIKDGVFTVIKYNWLKDDWDGILFQKDAKPLVAIEAQISGNN